MALRTNRQLRAARMLAAWEQTDVAAAAGVAIGTVRRMEQLEGTIRGHAATVQKIERAFERAGIRFTENGVERVEREAAEPADA